MPINTAQEIIDRTQFTPEMFRKETAQDLLDFIDIILSGQALLLEGRIGSSAYAAAASPQKDWVRRAEFCMCAAELIQVRINIILANVTGEGREIDVSHEGRQKKAYAAEAEDLIRKIVEGITSDRYGDFATGVSVSTHFGETT